jgi:hypothetical protein
MAVELVEAVELIEAVELYELVEIGKLPDEVVVFELAYLHAHNFLHLERLLQL